MKAARHIADVIDWWYSCTESAMVKGTVVACDLDKDVCEVAWDSGDHEKSVPTTDLREVRADSKGRTELASVRGSLEAGTRVEYVLKAKGRSKKCDWVVGWDVPPRKTGGGSDRTWSDRPSWVIHALPALLTHGMLAPQNAQALEEAGK